VNLKSLIAVLMAALTFFTPFTALGSLVKDSAEASAEQAAKLMSIPVCGLLPVEFWG